MFAAALFISAVFVVAFVGMFNAGNMWAPVGKPTLPLDLRTVVWIPQGEPEPSDGGGATVANPQQHVRLGGGGLGSGDGDDAVEAQAEMAEDAKSTEEAAASLVSDEGNSDAASAVSVALNAASKPEVVIPVSSSVRFLLWFPCP